MPTNDGPSGSPFLTSNAGISRPEGEPGPGEGPARGLTIRGWLALARRRWRLVCGVAVATALAVAAFVLVDPPQYKSRAAIRLADPQRPLAMGMEAPVVPKDRTINPVLILVELLRSRSVIGDVVDSLSLRLQPFDSRFWPAWLATGEKLSPTGLIEIQHAPSALGDTVVFTFGTDSVSLRNRHGESSAPYGRPLARGELQVVVRRHPAVRWTAFELLPREAAIDRVLRDLAVAPRKATDIVDVAYTTTDPVLAQRLSNRVITSFHASQERAVRAQAQRSAEFLDGQRGRIGGILKDAQAELSTFQSRRRLGAAAGRAGTRQADLAALDMRMADLEGDRRVYGDLLQRLVAGPDSERAAALSELAYAPEIANDPVIEKLYPQVLQYQVRVDSMMSGPNPTAATNPDLVQATALLGSTRAELVHAVRARLASTQARRRALQATRSAASAAAQGLPALDAEEARLQHRVDLLVTAADQLQLEFQKARLAEDLAAGDVRIIDMAPLPYQPDGLPDAGKIVLGLLLGLLLGLGLAGLLDAMSRVIRRPEDVEKLLPVRRLGVIPPLEDGKSPHARLRAALRMGRGPQAETTGEEALPLMNTEAFRRVYSSLVPGWGTQQRSILVTSTVPREGKTLIASNLALIFAGEGARVLLIDCDVRRPRLHQVFHLARAPGLMEVFADKPAAVAQRFSLLPGLDRGPPIQPPDPAEEAIQATSVARLSLLAAGARPGSPAELKGNRMRDLLKRLSPGFDVIILDTPPVLVSADAAILAPLADGVILVVRAGETERHAIEHSYEQLTTAGGHVLGVVLNDPAGEIPKYDRYYYAYEEKAEEAS